MYGDKQSFLVFRHVGKALKPKPRWVAVQELKLSYRNMEALYLFDI